MAAASARIGGKRAIHVRSGGEPVVATLRDQDKYLDLRETLEAVTKIRRKIFEE